MRKTIVAIATITLFFNIATAQKTDKRLISLDTALQRVLKDWKAAGFAVAVVEKNQVIYAKGFGYRDIEAKAPVTPNTQFAIGSCTKAFTAALLGILEQEGKLKLDEPATSYHPSLKFFNDDMNRHITVRDLMTHRTGLSRFDHSWYIFPSASRDTLVHRIRFMEPNLGIRQAFQYNNFMYMLQGAIVEKITGTSWDQQIKSRFFEPLGMNNSNTSLEEWMKAPDLAKGYKASGPQATGREEYYDLSGMGPAGSINSSVVDMAKWLIAWINGGKYANRQVIPAAYLTQAISSQMIVGAGLPTQGHPDLHFSNYGLGWILGSYRGHYRVEHDGNIDGFSASTAFFPSDSIGVVVLCNQSASMVPIVVRNIVADRVLKLPYHDWHSERMDLYKKSLEQQSRASSSLVNLRKQGTRPSHDLEAYTGGFVAEAGERVEVEKENDSLFAYAGGKKNWLRHYHYDVFEAFAIAGGRMDTSNSGTKIIFSTDESGDITALSVSFPGAPRPMVFKRGEYSSKHASLRLEEYEGVYEAAGIEAKIYMKGGLRLYVPGQPEYELVSLGSDKFKIKNLEGFHVQFEKDGSGKITAATFIQPNGNFRLAKKTNP